MQTQVYNSMQVGELPPSSLVVPGAYQFRRPSWAKGTLSAQSAGALTTQSAPLKLKLVLDRPLDEEFAAWDRLSDEALLDFEASLE